MIEKQSLCPAELVNLRARFESWRKNRKKVEPVPETLLAAAASLARKHGLNQVATALRLEYYRLKKAVESSGKPRLQKTPRQHFVEISHPVLVPDCLLEFENPSGAKLKMQLKGASHLDLVALGQAFWRIQP
jgi:hypothetical protein